MRKLLVALLLFGLGIGGAVIVAQPAGAHTLTNTVLTGSVATSGSPTSQTMTLTLNGVPVTNIPAGTYDFDVTDWATTHNFHLCAGTSSTRCNVSTTGLFKTSIGGTGEQTFSNITLTDGTYTYQCDAHSNMTHHFTVGTVTTTTGTTSTTTHTTTTTPTTTHSTTTSATTTTTTPTTTTTHTTTTTPTTTTSGGGGGGGSLTIHIVSAKGTAHSVVVKISSNKHGKAVAQLFKGTKRLAKASHTVPGKVTLKPSSALKPGRYTVKVKVTAGGKTATAKKTVKVS